MLKVSSIEICKASFCILKCKKQLGGGGKTKNIRKRPVVQSIRRIFAPLFAFIGLYLPLFDFNCQ
jgi:hypothetical protein